MRPGRAAGQAEDRAARVRVPVRRPSPVSAGTNTTPPESGTDRASASLSAAFEQAEPVAQPLHGRAGHEHRSLERVGQRAGAVHPRHRGQQPGLRPHDRGAGVGQHERPGAVGALGGAGREARLAEQRRLLVAGDARDRQRRGRGTRRVGVRRSRRSTGPPRAARAAARRTAAHSSADHCPASMSNSSVRDALEASVTCRVPPVSRAIR